MVDRNRQSQALTSSADNSDSLPSLVERLLDDVAQLFDQKLALLKIELKEDLAAYVRGGIVMIAAGLVAAVGFALANIALAFAVSTFFANLQISQPARYALGFAVTGAGYVVIGTIAILITRGRLVKVGIVPRRTLNELEKDKEWLQKEIEG